MHVAACQAASLIVMKYHVLCVCLLLLLCCDLASLPVHLAFIYKLFHGYA
jgi:hypothetical protein